MAEKLDKSAELKRARERLRKLGVDLDKDLPDYPSAVILPDYLPVRGTVLFGLNRVMPSKEMNRRFKKG